MNQHSDLLPALSKFSGIVDLIYQGATDFNVWPKVIEELAKYFNTPRGLIFTPLHTPDNGGFMIMHNFATQMEVWATHFQPHDLWTKRGFERNLVFTGSVVRDQDLMSEEEFLTTRMWKEFLQPANVGRVLVGTVFSPMDTNNLPVVCSMHRPFTAPYSQQDADEFKLIIPHISRALGVMTKLRDAEFKVASSLSAMDQLAHGIILFNVDGAVMFCNKEAQRILALQDGILLKNTPSLQDVAVLITKDHADQKKLDIAIRESISPDILSTQHFSKSISIQRISGKTPFILNFSSLPELNEFGLGKDAPRAIAFISDNDKRIKLNEEILKITYGLSQAEFKLAELIANGDANEVAANNLNVSVNTIKTQLQNIYFKTNTNNRAKLSKLLLSLVVNV